jgi:hypothetical protein
MILFDSWLVVMLQHTVSAAELIHVIHQHKMGEWLWMTMTVEEAGMAYF